MCVWYANDTYPTQQDDYLFIYYLGDWALGHFFSPLELVIPKDKEKRKNKYEYRAESRYRWCYVVVTAYLACSIRPRYTVYSEQYMNIID